MGQSSNDVIPTAIHVAAYVDVAEQLLPALQHLHDTLEEKADAVDHVVTTGRTHLMDAMPIRLSQELRGWASQIAHGIDRVSARCRGWPSWRRAPRPSARASMRTQSLATRIAAKLSEMSGPAVRHEQQLLREPERAGRGGGAERPTEDGGRQPDEDRQRSALDEQRADRGHRRKSFCLPCSRAAASCPARSTR